MAEGSGPDLGIRTIVGYKLVKAIGELGASLLLVGLFAAGWVQPFEEAIATYRAHAAEAWTMALSRFIADATTAHHLEVFACLLAVDGILSGVEGWSLHRRYSWSSGFVVFATGSFLPFELVKLAEKVSALRISLALINLAIVLYLLFIHQRRAVR